jgi:hypothetical protein
MLTDIASSEVLSAHLTSNSMFAIFRLFTFIIASAIWIFESFLDQHTLEIDYKLANQKSGTKSWYRTMALRFQYGFKLVPDKDYFDNGNDTAETIALSKIIKYAAVNESEDESRLIIKIAGEVGGVLTDFTDPAQVEAIENYFKEVKYPGKITIINYKPDKLYLTLRIKRDVLVLTDTGMNKRYANYPIIEALQEFMKELPFDGDLKLSALVDKVQKVLGVLDATLIEAKSTWIDPTQDGYGVPQPIFTNKVAESGYFEIVTFDNITYVV